MFIDFEKDLEGGFSKIVKGCGSPYIEQSFAMETNQDLLFSLEVVRICLAILFKMLLGNRVIMPKRERCLSLS